MANKLDDLDAVRTIVETLQPFEKVDQERILRWVREKLGLQQHPTEKQNASHREPEPKDKPGGGASARSIREFVAEKSPRSDNQFAATVAYYYRFEAPDSEHKDSISANDLQEACRQAGRPRLGDPGKTLRNAHGVGLLDKAGEAGAFRINTVGENLVAMTLPSGDKVVAARQRRSSKKQAARRSGK